MKIDSVHIEKIKTAFANMQSREDLLHILNEAKPLVYGEKAIPFELKQLSYYTSLKPRYSLGIDFTLTDLEDIIPGYKTNPVSEDVRSVSELGNKFDIKNFIVPKKNHRYSSFTIKKKSGGIRTIHSPVNGLKAIQKTLAFILQCVFEPHKSAMGFVRDKSIVDNARLHEGNRYVYNVDLKDFFPSIDQARFWKCLQLRPFNLTSEKKGEFDIEKDLRDGYGTFFTTEGEIIHYRISNGIKGLLKNKGDYERYEKRFISSNTNINIREILRIRKLASEGDEEAQKTEIRFKEDIIKRKEEKRQMFQDADFYIINNEKEKYAKSSRLNIANIIASLCCTEMEVERKNESGEWEKVKKNVLPQGAPTSPVVTNIVCQRLDYLLSSLARRFALRYSRYADDITFSSMHNVYQLNSDFLKELHRIIADQGFHIKESKTRLQKDGYRKEVTGLLVNEKVNIQTRYVKQLRMWLHRWEIFGFERASYYFTMDYSNTNLLNGERRIENKRVDRWNVKEYIFNKGQKEKRIPNMKNIIEGKLNYLKMVKGSENKMYLKLKGRFDILVGKVELKTERQVHLYKVIDLIFDNGIDDAMDYFKPSD